MADGLTSRICAPIPRCFLEDQHENIACVSEVARKGLMRERESAFSTLRADPDQLPDFVEAMLRAGTARSRRRHAAGLIIANITGSLAAVSSPDLRRDHAAHEFAGLLRPRHRRSALRDLHRLGPAAPRLRRERHGAVARRWCSSRACSISSPLSAAIPASS